MPNEYLLFVGTYTESPPTHIEGIHSFRFNGENGQLAPLSTTSGIENPSYLAIDPHHRRLYAVSEVGDLERSALYAYEIDIATGNLTFLNKQSTHGTSSCYVSLDQQARNALVANYGAADQSVVMLPINMGGYLAPASSTHRHSWQFPGAKANRQEAPHAHSILVDTTNQYALACDLGTNQVLIYQLDAENSQLIPNADNAIDLPPGSGPRHLIYHPSLSIVYVINELNATLSVLSFEHITGKLTDIQAISAIPDDSTTLGSCSDIHILPSGKFLYAGSRGNNSIGCYAVDEQTGYLNLVKHQSTNGKTPRNFMIDPTGRYLLVANQDSANIVVFAIDTKTGYLHETGIEVNCPTPVCLKMMSL